MSKIKQTHIRILGLTQDGIDKKIQAIKGHRGVTQQGLKESKDAIDALYELGAGSHTSIETALGSTTGMNAEMSVKHLEEHGVIAETIPLGFFAGLRVKRDKTPKRYPITIVMKSGQILHFTAEEFKVNFIGDAVDYLSWKNVEPPLLHIDPTQIAAVYEA